MVDYSRSLDTRRVNEGEMLSTGFYRDTISSGNTKVFVFVNNSDSDVRVPGAVVRARYRSRVFKQFNVDIDTEGDSLPIVNKKSGASDSPSSFNAFVAGDGETGVVSNPGTEFNDKLIPAGSSGSSPGAEDDEGGNIIAPGDNMVIGVENLDGNDGIVSVDFDFHRMRVP